MPGAGRVPTEPCAPSVRSGSSKESSAAPIACPPRSAHSRTNKGYTLPSAARLTPTILRFSALPRTTTARAWKASWLRTACATPAPREHTSRPTALHHALRAPQGRSTRTRAKRSSRPVACAHTALIRLR
ncbi:hypothetical protein T484DRAFT_3585118 [Baffinella frigidus]|nr:hypothetical protein T484DRAFT_3585118 [Cryptophyta sp. CCMP2293]